MAVACLRIRPDKRKPMLAHILSASFIALFWAIQLPKARLTEPTTPKSPSQQQLQGLIDRVVTLPVEYRADLVFSLQRDAPVALTSKRNKQLLVDLFEAASSAQIETPVDNATDEHNSIASQEVLNLEWMPYDTLDIQTRAISFLVPQSPDLSWRLFQEIRLPAAHQACEDALVPDLDPYYELMASVLNVNDSQVTPSGQPKMAYLSEQIQKLQSPAALRGFARGLMRIKLRSNESDQLLNTLAEKIPEINGTDREMTGAERGEISLSSAIGNLVKQHRATDSLTSPLLAAYRSFLIKILHGQGCSDSSLDRATVANDFNSLDPHQIGDDPKPIRPLTAHDLLPTTKGGAAKHENITGNSEVQEEVRRVATVFLANQKAHQSTDSADDYLQPEPSDIRDILRHATSVTDTSSLSDVAKYEDTQSTLMLLIEFLPPGPSFKDAIDAELAYLNLNQIEQTSPLSWLRAFKELIMISRPVSQAENAKLRATMGGRHATIMMPSPNASFIRQTMRRYQSDPIISTYLAYEDLIRPDYVSFAESRNRAPL